MASFSSSSSPVRKLMRSTSVLFLQVYKLRVEGRPAGGRAPPRRVGGRPPALLPLQPASRACLVDMEVTRRWSPVSLLRRRQTDVWRGAAGEKADEEKCAIAPLAALLRPPLDHESPGADGGQRAAVTAMPIQCGARSAFVERGRAFGAPSTSCQQGRLSDRVARCPGGFLIAGSAYQNHWNSGTAPAAAAAEIGRPVVSCGPRLAPWHLP